MSAFQFWNCVTTPCFGESFTVGGQMPSRMERSTFLDNCPERIDIIRHRLHHIIVPLIESIDRFPAYLWMFSSDIVLLIRILDQIEQHLIREQVVSIVVGPHIEPGPHTHTTLAYMGTLTDDEVLLTAV